MFSVMSRNFWMSSEVFGEEVGWGGLGNKGPLVRRKRGDRCSRSGGKEGVGGDVECKDGVECLGCLV